MAGKRKLRSEAHIMLSAIDPNAEMGPPGMYLGAAFLALVACGTLVSGLPPRWRATAKWRGNVRRSPFGSFAFCSGLLIMGAGMVVCGAQNQHGPMKGAAAILFWAGVVVLVLGPVYDLISSITKR